MIDLLQYCLQIPCDMPLKPLLIGLLLPCSLGSIGRICFDKNADCFETIASDSEPCNLTNSVVAQICPKSCGKCALEKLPEFYDIKKIPKNLVPVAFLVGKWRSEFSGKAFFPTTPTFTFGEEIDFRISTDPHSGQGLLNFS
ncbi:hypothetical protein AB6A40_004531 [Gnathostoma spinigerum]|uniref:ShKT domain-containing protein n=1 Tax=Gnathostoma spinigerum TaxID=75299 RepID=A0ABD6EM79_9BILA